MEITDKIFKQALNEMAATENGQIVLAALKDICSWEETFLSAEKPELTHYFAVKRGVYGGLRKLIKKEYLKIIEFNFERKSNDGNNINGRSGRHTSTKRATRAKSKQE